MSIYEHIRYYINSILWYNTYITPSNHTLNYYTFLYLVLLVLPLSFFLKLVEASCWKGKQGSETRQIWVPILALLFLYFCQVTQLLGVSVFSYKTGISSPTFNGYCNIKNKWTTILGKLSSWDTDGIQLMLTGA